MRHPDISWWQSLSVRAAGVFGAVTLVAMYLAALLAARNPAASPAAAILSPGGGLVFLAALGMAYFYSRYFVQKRIVGLKNCIEAWGPDGSLDFPKENGPRDEIAALCEALLGLPPTVSAEKDGSVGDTYRGAAFNEAMLAMMIVDRNLIVIDRNRACHDLIREYSPEIRKMWPEFDAGSLVGNAIDRLHDDPTQLRAILADPQSLPHIGDVSIGSLKLEVRISAIYDAGGAYVGNIMEWRNVGADRLSSGIMEAIGQNQGLIEYTPDGRVVAANGCAQACFGWSADKIQTCNFVDFFADRTAGSDLLVQLQSGQGHVGELSRCRVDGAQVWTDSMINLVRDSNGDPFRIVEIATDISGKLVERSRIDEERNIMLAAQDQVVDALKAGLGALAEGDLTHDITDAFGSEYEQLRQDFNTATEKLRSTLSKLVGVARNVQDGTSEISQASDDLSRRTESQAATLASTAAALDELTTSVRSSAEGAQAADRSVAGAKSNAQSGGAVVLEAVGAMRAIEKSSEQISQIIGVIDDIAFQTNLLALNAGVEAARAGEAGRGFAVVASEVRALAQRSSEAAKEIKELISASSTHVGRGVELVDKTGAALENIVSSVEEISIQVSEIASSSQQQAEGLGEINEGMNRLDGVTQQNAAMVEEATAASHAMRHEAEILAELTGFFKTSSSEAEASPILRFRPIPREDGGDPPGGAVELATANTETNAPVEHREAVGETHPARGPDADGWEDF